LIQNYDIDGTITGTVFGWVLNRTLRWGRWKLRMIRYCWILWCL